MVLLEADKFLGELHKLYERNKGKGTVYLTMKRSDLTKKFKKKKNEEQEESEEYYCLLRATDGKKKISATLTAKDYARFQTGYQTVLKAHMDALKKREREKKKKKSSDSSNK